MAKCKICEHDLATSGTCTNSKCYSNQSKERKEELLAYFGRLIYSMS
jgi:hypothetical protein